MANSPELGLEERLKQIWDHRITAWILGIAAFGATISFLRHSPIPGIAIAVLGVVAAVMSIRTLSSYEKFFWTLMAFCLLYAEIRAIRVDRIETNKHALEDRAQQDAQFIATESLVSGFSGLQASLEKQFSNPVPVQTFGKGGKKESKVVTPPQ